MHQRCAGPPGRRRLPADGRATLAARSPAAPAGCGVLLKATVMLDPKTLEELSARLSAVIAASPAADIEKNARALLASFFSRLDLVTREDFDVQGEVLRRTREKLKALEERVARLEAAGNDPAD